MTGRRNLDPEKQKCFLRKLKSSIARAKKKKKGWGEVVLQGENKIESLEGLFSGKPWGYSKNSFKVELKWHTALNR